MRLDRGTLIKAFAAVAFVASSFGSLHAQEKQGQDKTKPDTTLVVDDTDRPEWADRYPDLYDDYQKELEVAAKQYDIKVKKAEGTSDQRKAQSNSRVLNEVGRTVGQAGRAKRGGINLAEGAAIGSRIVNTIGQSKARKIQRETNEERAELNAENAYIRAEMAITKKYDRMADRLDANAEKEALKEQKTAEKQSVNKTEDAIEKAKQQHYLNWAKDQVKNGHHDKTSYQDYEQAMKAKQAAQTQQTPRP